MDIDILQLVKKSQNGDSEAFGQLYDLFAQRIFRYISLKIQDNSLAQDLLQETFIKAWKGLPNLPRENLNFSAWLYKISGNCINDYFRKKYRSPDTVELQEALFISTPDRIGQQLDIEADMQVIEIAFKKLPAQYRQVLELLFIQDFSLQETAKILQKNYISIRVLQHRALKRLKDIIGNDHVLEY